MKTKEPIGPSSVVELHRYYRGKTGGDEVAAALLTLAEIIRRTPADSTGRLASGLDAAASLAERLAGDRAKPVARAEAPQRPAANGSATVVKTKPRTPARPAADKKTNGQHVKVRSDYNRADLCVLDDFLPAGETRRLVEFLGTLGIRPEDRPQMQELLTLAVYYVTKVRKTACTHSHVHTVLAKLGVATPGDLGARLRDVERRRGYINPSDGDDIRLTRKGEHWVEVELPRRVADAKAGKQ